MEDIKQNNAWYHTFFDEDYLKYWSLILSPEKTRKETEFVLRTLALPKSARILDLCCGQGRHALEFAKKGYYVVGLDLSEALINYARRSAGEQNISVEFVHSDMRDISFVEEFDAVVNLFSSFGYLENDEEHEKVLRAVAKALKPMGKFLVDLPGYGRLFALQHRYNESLNLAVENSFDVLSGRLKTRWSLTDENGEKKERISIQRLYTFTELDKMLKASGYRVKQVFGEYDGSDYTLNSSRMIVLAEKS